MALPVTFASLAAGNQPASLLDQNFAAVGAMGVTQCTATGTNAVTLTPAANQPAVASYTNYLMVSFVPGANSTAALTLQVGALALLPVYQPNGTTQAGSGSFTTTSAVLALYNSALNSGGGGWQIISASASTSVSDINGGQVAGFRNAIINGDFKVWQRGTSFALTTTLNAGAYGADRWAAYMPSSAAGIFNRDTSITAGLGFQYNAKVGRTAASALTNPIAMNQALESANSIPLTGKTATISFYAKAGANYSASASGLPVTVFTGTGTDQSVANMVAGSWSGSAQPITGTATLTTSWQRFTFSGTIAASATQIGVSFQYIPTGVAGADDNFYVTGIQLEPGGLATPFENRMFNAEFLLCSRTYQKSFTYATAPAQNVGANTGEPQWMYIRGGGSLPSYWNVRWPVAMRTAPTVTLYNPAAANAQVRDITGGTDCSGTTTSNISDGGYYINTTGNGASSTGNNLALHWSASAEL